MLPHIFNGNGTISIMIEGKMKPVDTAHKYYEDIKAAIQAGDWDKIPGLVNIKDKVEAAINAGTAAGVVTIKDGQVFYNGTRVHNTLTDRIVTMAKDGFDIGHMVKFLENLMGNPSFRAVQELYDFLEAGSIPITENGTFLTYKKIKNNWTDIHSGTFDNSIGATCSMPRNMVDEDSNRTCSAGLHVCSYDYLPHFSSSSNDRVVICEVNPADVVAIPADYNNTKMRVCKYVVIGEVEDYKQSEVLAKNAVIFTNDVKEGRAGTVNHTNVSANAKQIGKDVESALEYGEIDSDQIGEICNVAGLNNVDTSFIQDLADDGDFKRVGKRIAKHIANNDMNAASFNAEFEAAKDADEDTDSDSDDVCYRCGAELDDDSDECPSCGYWN